MNVNEDALARYSEHDTSRIFQAADAFRANCPLRDGSQLFGETSVLRPDVLDRIHTAFAATPDESDRTIIYKFRDIAGG
jgi:5-methylcytosine-specific restriction protein B